jgi:hypothetical protein
MKSVKFMARGVVTERIFSLVILGKAVFFYSDSCSTVTTVATVKL